MVAETLYTFTAADITSVVIECTACGHGVVITDLGVARHPAMLRCPGCDRAWFELQGRGAPLAERRLIEALLEMRQRVADPPAATVKLLVSTERREHDGG